MSFGQLQQQLLRSGHDYLGDRAAGLIADAAKEVFQAERWLFREVETVVGQGVRVPGLGQITQVRTLTGRVLPFRGRDELEESYGALDTLGAPQAWYAKGWETIGCWPSNDEQLVVRHYARFPWVVNDVAVLTPTSPDAQSLIPEDFQDLIVLQARVLALEDSDETKLRNELAERLQARYAQLQDQAMSHNSDEGGMVEFAGGDWA